MTKDEALRLALEALDSVLANHKGAPVLPWIEARDAIKAALEAKDEPSMKVEGPLHVVCQCDKCKAQPEQEPVAWMIYTKDGQSVYVTDNPTDIQEGQRALPLYTTPPQRTWVGLTDEEMMQIYIDLKSVAGFYSVEKYARAIEAKLKEKNT